MKIYIHYIMFINLRFDILIFFLDLETVILKFQDISRCPCLWNTHVHVF